MTHTLVVGGTRGVGRAVARLFAQRGHAVSAIGRSAPEAPARVSGVAYFQADVADEPGCEAALARCVETSGKLNHVVFVQRYRGSGGDPVSAELTTTVESTARIIQQIRPLLDDHGPRSLVAVSSVAGRLVAPDQSLGYHLAKAALEHLVRFHAVTMAPSGTRMNGVVPGTLIKDENRAFYAREDAITNALTSAVPLARMGTAEDVARATWFLCSEDAAFITGQMLVVDGGASLVSHESLMRSRM